MNVIGTWATNTEIVEIATLLQTTTYVFTKYATGQKWLRYEPLLVFRNIQLFSEYIYLTNLNDHFERVIECV